MAATLEVLERRLTALEEEVKRLRQYFDGRPGARILAGREVPMLQEARAQQPAISAAVARAFAEMGITGEPIDHEKLREMMAECGVKPEENLLSREIIAMRDE